MAKKDGKGQKKAKKNLTPLERMEDMALTSTVSEELAPHLGGVQDKTLSEFIINLVEKHIKKSNPSEGDSNLIGQAQEVRQRLADNGAPDIPLSLCRRLLELVQNQSPRIKRWQIAQQEKLRKAMEKQKAAGGSVLSSSHVDNELSQSFPGLAGANLSKAVPLADEFYDHGLNKAESNNKKEGRWDSKKPAADRKKRPHSNENDDTSKRRGISNLPAWMTKDSNDNKRPRTDDSKKDNGELTLYGIYQGRVQKTLDFGLVVEVQSSSNIPIKNPNHREGMVYKTQLPSNYDRNKDFRKGSSVWIKVISMTAQKLVLSVKDVDQKTGVDIMPYRNTINRDSSQGGRAVNTETSTTSAMSSTAVVHPGLDVAAVKRQQAEEDAKNRYLAASAGASGGMGHYGPASSASSNRDEEERPRRTGAKQLTEHELFEAQQLVRSGVLPVEQYPTYDAELGMLAVEETEEETEVELVEIEPAFLRGQTKRSGKAREHLEPVKIVKNPDGSLQRAAMQQLNLAKERRELRQAQANDLIDSIPKDLNRPWEDPMPEAGERHFAQELRSINVMSQLDAGAAPEWKQKAQNKALSYGIISNKSITEQRMGLPIYRLKKELVSAIKANQVLVVIGETGSGKVSFEPVRRCSMALTFVAFRCPDVVVTLPF